MKKTNKLLVALIMLFSIGKTSFAQMDNLANMSAEWVRTGARNAATDASDIVVYNPAGLTHLSEGLHVNFSNQTLFRNPSHSYDLGMGQGVKSFSQKGADPFLPNLYAAYCKNKWSVFTGAFITGGGGTANYPTGSITTDLIGLQALAGTGGAYMDTKDQNLKASSMYLTTTLGMTRAINKTFAFSFAVRYLAAKNAVKAGVTLTSSPIDMPDMPLYLNYEESAGGMGAVVAMNVTPCANLNMSVRYESQVNLNFETKTITDDLGATVNGQKNPRDLPAVFAFGAAYKVNNSMSLYGDYMYYFQKNANWGNSSMVTNEKSWSSMAGDASTAAMGVQYIVTPKVIASMGFGMTMYAYNDKDGYYTKPGTFESVQDNNSNINMGFAWKVAKIVTVNAGYMHTFWAKNQIKALNAQPLDVNVTVNNSMNVVALGVDLAF